ncbi:TetR/AcrR family transcriptional regulator [Aeromicrobium choanae]|uniref:Transcriptional regulator, TetR family n=1 Tax=Aeromicrobium choanae TaxID=1736691 RepID=A0A1T4Z7W0_9ACTN|nr:TetR/AcrR family transcriptional regulator [Aeromicrobium choanae]SKB10157.1 transcriptional regulator, TetR family [Aeromicrobium choanae]
MRSRARIMAATVRLIEDDGFAAVTVASVAREAGVTRQTVYSNFGTLTDLVSETMTTTVFEAYEAVRERTDAAPTARAFVVELVVAARAVLRDRPVLAALLRPDPHNPVFEADMMQRAVPAARLALTPILERSPGLARHLDEITEMLVRFALSLLLFDSDLIATDEGLRDLVDRWLGQTVTLLDT